MFSYGPLCASLSLEVFTTVNVFSDVVPYNPAEDYQCFRGMYFLQHQDRRLSRKQKAGYLPAVCLAYTMTLMMEAVHFFETLVNFYEATWHNIAGGTVLHYVNCFPFQIKEVSRDCLAMRSVKRHACTYYLKEFYSNCIFSAL
jgi:hypothetical protein